MLKSIRIHNLILIDTVEMRFGKGLNILTGETGSGKTAILTALWQVLGDRADCSLIRKGKPCASIEATFSLSDNFQVEELLKKEEISFSSNGDLILRRELLQTGKSRAFCNDQICSVSLLKAIGHLLVEMVSQNSHQFLTSSEYQRNLLDHFGDIADLVRKHRNLYQLATLKKIEFEKICADQKQAKELVQVWKEELNQIEKTAWKQEEEELLEKEHRLLAHANEIREKVDSVYFPLLASDHSLLFQLKELQKILDSLTNLHSDFFETFQLMQNANIELEEVAHALCSLQGKVENNPFRLAQIEERLKEIELLKRRFGTFEQVEERKNTLQNNLQNMDNTNIEALKKQWEIQQKQALELAQEISIKRKKYAKSFAHHMQMELQKLNLTGAQFSVDITSADHNETGIDTVQFLFSANIGVSLALLKACASGGELSRLMLAMKTLLAQKNDVPCIVFDEIDANVGGKTASMIGHHLKELGKHTQVLCITHFVQVAQQAEHHFLVKKETQATENATTVKKLSLEEKNREYSRMIGK